MSLRWSMLGWIVGPAAALSACGGGSSSAPGNGSFTVSLNPSSVTVAQGSQQAVGIQVIGQEGFSGSVNITATGLPAGITVTPASVAIVSGTSGNLNVSVSSAPVVGSTQFTLKATSGSLEVDLTVPLTLTSNVAASPVPFITLGGGIQRAFYDESRQLLFATNTLLNEVDVLSGTSLSVSSRVIVPQPLGIDQMPDGNTLVVGTLTQGLYTIDENTLAVSRYLSPNFSNPFGGSTTALVQPVAMANGKVLIIGQDIGLSANWIYGGEYLIEWDSSTGTFTVGIPDQGAGFEIDNLKRSADHNWAVFAADKFYLYNSSNNTFTSSSVPIDDASQFGIRDVAANPTGTQFASVSANTVFFYDQQFNRLGSVTTSTNGTFQLTNAMYSTDGSRLYWELLLNGEIVDALDTTAFTELGHADLGYTEATLMWVDSAQRAFFSPGTGVGITNCSKLRTQNPTTEGGPLTIPTVSSIPLGASVTVSYLDYFSEATITFGGVPVTVQSNSPLTLTPPPSSIPGPVDTVVIVPDGEAYVTPQAFSYGLDVVAATATLVPPNGNPTIGVYGFGMLNGPFSPPTVSVGGQPSPSVTIANPGIGGPFYEVYVQLPDEGPGPASIAANGNNGAGTLSNAITYIPSATTVTATGLLQLIYDTQRSVIYALKSSEIDILNPATQQWGTPLRPSSATNLNYVSMALTPDDSEILVIDYTNSTLTIVNIANPSQSTVMTLPVNSPHGVAATNIGKAFIVNAAAPIELDLSNATYTSVAIGQYCAFTTTPDGSHVVAVANDSSGEVLYWNSATDSFTSQNFADGFWTDVAITANGSTFAAVTGGPGFAGAAAGFFDPDLHYMNATVYPDLAPPSAEQALGAIFSASGQTLLIPLGNSIDFMNVATGTLTGRLMTPEPIPVLVYPVESSGVLALDPSGQTVYAITTSGLMILSLPSPVDQLTPPVWPFVAKGRNLEAHASARVGMRTLRTTGARQNH